MASSGTVSVAVTEYDALEFNWAQVSQSIDNNTTTINWNMQLVATKYGAIYSSTARTWTVTVNGNNYSGTNNIGINDNERKILASGSTVIPHNADGTKTFSFSFTQPFNMTFAGVSIGTKSGSGSGVLNTIPRASSLTAYNGTLGTSNTLTINRASSGFTHTIAWSCGAASGIVATQTASTSVAWDASNGNTISLAAQNKTGTSVSVVLTLTTYSGSVAIGTSQNTIMMAIPASVAPSISAVTIAEAGEGVPSGFPYVQSKSKLSVAITATGNQGSTITAYSTSIGGVGYAGNSFQSNTISGYGNIAINVTVTDSRGRTATTSKSVYVYAYDAPNIAALSVARCNSDGTENDQGEYMNIAFDVSITPLTTSNAKNLVIKYKKSTESTYQSVAISMPSYTINSNRIIAAETGSSYDIILEATDSFGTTPAVASAPTAYTIFNVRANGMGFAFGKVSEKDAIEFDDPIYIAGVLFGIESSTIDGWTYHKWADGRMEMEKNIAITELPCTTALGGWYRTELQSQTNYPVAFVGDAPNVVMSFSTGSGTGAMIWETTASALTVAPSYYLIRPTSSNAVTGVVSIIAKGRWKI